MAIWEYGAIADQCGDIMEAELTTKTMPWKGPAGQMAVRPRKSLFRRAQSTVEFALVFPIFILLLMGVVDLSRYMFIQSTMSHVIRTSLRYAVTGQQSTTVSGGTTTTDSLRTSILKFANRVHPVPNMIPLTAGASGKATGDTFVLEHSADAGVTWSDLTSSDALVDVSGDLIRITYTYSFNYLTPFMSLLGKSGVVGNTITASTYFQAEHF